VDDGNHGIIVNQQVIHLNEEIFTGGRIQLCSACFPEGIVLGVAVAGVVSLGPVVVLLSNFVAGVGLHVRARVGIGVAGGEHLDICLEPLQGFSAGGVAGKIDAGVDALEFYSRCRFLPGIV
jgi:hypothetical protein